MCVSSGERSSRGPRRLALALAFAAATAARGAEPPALVVQAPPELAPVVRELERLGPEALEPAMRLTGASGWPEPGPPIVVVLAPLGSATARSVPPWVSGYADGVAGVIVLLPARVDRYPDLGLGPLLRHEVAHVLTARAARGAPLPRWFDEGLAMAAGRDWALGDRARVALAVMRDDSLPLARIDSAFAGGETAVESAYALSGDLMRELLRRHGDGAAAAILAGVGRGERFRDAFRAATGESVGDFERGYWGRRTFWDRWVPVISSSVVLWAGIALLAVAAFRRRRARDARLLLEMEREERAFDEPPEP